MPGEHQHLRWTRLPDSALRRTRQARPPSPPVRGDRSGHGRDIESSFDENVRNLQQLRTNLGVDPFRLLVLELTGHNVDLRGLLERFGIDVLEARELEQEPSANEWAVTLTFTNSHGCASFEANPPVIEGFTRQTSVWHASGIDPLRLNLNFSSRVAAKSFHSDSSLHHRIGAQVGSVSTPTQLRHQYLVQFPDEGSLRSFHKEVEAYQVRGQAPSLTENQRVQLFDSLETMRLLSPDDRRGKVLQTQGAPTNSESFYLDVDLWHPGTSLKVGDVIRDFSRLVPAHGGEVTDPPTSVAETLLISRVKGGVRLLDALLNYDRVARVDLPSKIAISRYSVFTAPVPQTILEIPLDGPMACVVDSGLVAGHPLLQSAVLDERDFDSGENSVVDQVGHGTHVSGVVVYGDLAACMETNQWIPKVRILSAKVMRRVAQVSSDGQVIEEPQAAFAERERAETQIRKAVTTFANERGCRIFNLSIGDLDTPLDGKRQLPWALLLDELARDLNVVLVVPTGNVSSPTMPTTSSEEEFRNQVFGQLLTPEHRLIDPATSALSLTVGALAKSETPFQSLRDSRHRTLVASKAGTPSPFTRAGFLDSRKGIRRTIKPELMGFGGNLSVSGNQWMRNDQNLGVISLHFNYQSGRILQADSGTSYAAPYVTHVAALVENNLRQNGGGRPTANLIRALTVHSAEIPESSQALLDRNGEDAESTQLRTMGYGLPSIPRALYSNDHRAVLIAEDSIVDNQLHMYALELPEALLAAGGNCRFKVTLAYDPPVRGARQEYLSRTLSYSVLRGLSNDEVMAAVSRIQPGQELQVQDVKKVGLRPTKTVLMWSTVQSAYRKCRTSTLTPNQNQGGTPLIHIVVQSQKRFEAVDTPQSYALVVSLEHENEQVRVYQAIRQRLAQRVRVGS